MRPLQSGRQLFSWFCVDVLDKPLTKNQVLSRKIFRFFYGVKVTTLIVSINASLFKNYGSVNGIDELFYEFYQLDLTLYSISAYITIFGPKLPPLFRNLDTIYNACKIHYYVFFVFFSSNIIDLWLIQTPDPDERLATTNEKCEYFYRICNTFTKLCVGFITVMSGTSILICQLNYGFGCIYFTELYHPIKIM